MPLYDIIPILQIRKDSFDFGRCGYGYFLYDMAGAILGLFPNRRMLFIQGYESEKKLEADDVRYLESFFIMSVIENYTHHASNPEETIE